MNKFLIVLLSFVVLTNLSAQSQENYAKIKIDLTIHTLKEVAALGLETDHGDHKPFKQFINVFNAYEIDLLKEAGIKYEVLIPDVSAYYKLHGTTEILETESRSGNCEETAFSYDYETPENYESGDMGGYLTYQQILDNLDRMASLYPNLITERLVIEPFKTHQGRDLYYLVISNTPANVDLNKPQIFYNSLHHAREPNSISQTLFYMWFLLENYGTDDEVTYLVNHTTMFFMPIVNPDGYVYNESIEPEGGGLWRKNRYPNENGDTVGVDLNRNYGFEWNFDNEGSSGNENSQTYRGPSAFSEPETQAVRALCNANNFKIALNYHTFGNLLIHPWGFSDEPTDEDFTFKSLAGIMAAENDFLVGTGTETVGYVVNGDSDDWMYGEQNEKEKIYSMTPEVGPAFWPGSATIDQLNKSAMRHNLNAAHLLLNYAWVEELFAVATITSNEGSLFFEVEKSGFVDDAISFSAASLTPGVELTENSYSDLLMTLGEKREFQVNYSIENDFDGDEISIELSMDNGDYVHKTILTKTYNVDLGDPSVLLENDVNTFDGFETDGEWGLSQDEFFSPPFSIGNAPFGNYGNNVNSELILVDSFNVEGLDHAFVKYQVKFDIENDYDYAQLLVSADGSGYFPVCGEHTNNGSVFQPDEPLYDNVLDWSAETICLDDLLPASQLNFKFKFFSDGFVNGDGFYFDDLVFEGFGTDVSTTSVPNGKFIFVSPNPAVEQIAISMDPQDYNSGLTFKIVDVFGKLIKRDLINRPRISVDISELSQGTYVLQIEKNGQFVSTSKFIKK